MAGSNNTSRKNGKNFRGRLFWPTKVGFFCKQTAYFFFVISGHDRHSHSLTLTHTHSLTLIEYSHLLTHTYSHSLTHSHSLTLTHTHSHSLTRSHSHSFTQSLTLTHSTHHSHSKLIAQCVSYPACLLTAISCFTKWDMVLCFDTSTGRKTRLDPDWRCFL